MPRPAQPPESATLRPLRAALLGWYARHKRDLPWRQDQDAYRVWVSEIMLQQTRVAAVLEHYRLFLEAFPTVGALAAAPEERVLALWSGLGYYRRARMLHQAARFVVAELGGNIPRDLDGLRKLPGVGRYTAAAIASIAYGEAVAVVDGNVERVLSRMDGEARDDGSAWPRAQQLLDAGHPGDWNQAMMELGATICAPQNPQCLMCPVRQWCLAPGAETRRPQLARKRARMTRALVEHRQRVYRARGVRGAPLHHRYRLRGTRAAGAAGGAVRRGAKSGKVDRARCGVDASAYGTHAKDIAEARARVSSLFLISSAQPCSVQ